MTNHDDEAKVWNVTFMNYGEHEYLDFSLNELQVILREEWQREFNGLIIGPDIECRGQLFAFFWGERAYIAYEDFGTKEWKCSYDMQACERPDWNDLIWLAPDDAQDRPFRKCSIISKGHAWQIIQTFLASGELQDMYVSGATGKPAILEQQ